MPFRFTDDGAGDDMPGGLGPTRRENVDAGTDVIDLAKMRRELEADRARRQGGGG